MSVSISCEAIRALAYIQVWGVCIIVALIHDKEVLYKEGGLCVGSLLLAVVRENHIRRKNVCILHFILDRIQQ